MSAHARLGPSAASRWMSCPGSVQLIEKLTAAGQISARSSSGAADEGTAAHQVRGDALDLGLDAWDFVGTSLVINGVRYDCTDEVAAYLQPGMDWLNEQPGELIVEHRVNLDKWLPGQFGTLDTAIIDRDARLLRVSDLKFGAGVPVDAVENKQLRIYALGVIDNFNLYHAVDRIQINIDQPRAGGMKFWEVSLDDLLAFGEEVRAAGVAVDAADAPLNPSEVACQFCEAKHHCDARLDWIIEISGLNLDDDIESEPNMPTRSKITPERRWWIVKHAHLVEQWLAKLYEDCIEAAKAGSPDPGSKLVIGRRGNRRYVDEESAVKLLEPLLGEDAYTKKVISPAQAEKVLKPTRKNAGNPDALSALNRLITQDEGKPILVPDTDDREAISPVDDLLDDD